MKISVVIPTLGDPHNLRILMKCLEEQTLPSANFEVIIVNNSTKAVKLCSSKLNLKIFREKSKGSYVARNTGVQKSEGEFIFFTDDDCLPDKNWLINGLKMLEKNDNRNSIISGAIKIFGVSSKLTVYELFSYYFDLQQERYAKKSRAATANMFISKNTFIELGCFNALYQSGGDFEFCKRAKRAGRYVKFCPSAVVEHPARASRAELISKSRRKALNMRERSKSVFRRLYFIFKIFLNIILGILKIISLKSIDISRKIKLILLVISYYKVQLLVLLSKRNFTHGS